MRASMMRTFLPISEMDPEVVTLCQAINRIPGLRTNSSCSGHGKEQLEVWLQASNVRALYILTRCIDTRYGGASRQNIHTGKWEPWTCEVQDTDLPSRPVVFRLASGPFYGPEAFAQAETLAKRINEFLNNPKWCQHFRIRG